MVIIPGERVGDLQFRSSRDAVAARLGAPDRLVDYGDGREIWIYESGPDVTFLESGLVGVSLGAGPAILWERDLFRFDAAELRGWFAGRGVDVAIEVSQWGDTTLDATATCGLLIYYAEGDLVPCDIGVQFGRWDHGRMVTTEEP
jgi:hypothetical protein